MTVLFGNKTGKIINMDNKMKENFAGNYFPVI
jgi:hypothetical protein